MAERRRVLLDVSALRDLWKAPGWPGAILLLVSGRPDVEDEGARRRVRVRLPPWLGGNNILQAVVHGLDWPAWYRSAWSATSMTPSWSAASSPRRAFLWPQGGSRRILRSHGDWA